MTEIPRDLPDYKYSVGAVVWVVRANGTPRRVEIVDRFMNTPDLGPAYRIKLYLPSPSAKKYGFYTIVEYEARMFETRKAAKHYADVVNSSKQATAENRRRRPIK